MSVYAELVTAVTPLGFHHYVAEESDTAYLGRLALAASALPDFEWSCLTAETVEWVNASAKRLNFGKTVDSCPGFGELSVSSTSDDVVKVEVVPDSLEGMGIAPGGYIDEDGKLVITEFSIVDPSQLLDPHCVIGKAHVSSEVPTENKPLDTVPEDSGDGDIRGEKDAAGFVPFLPGELPKDALNRLVANVAKANDEMNRVLIKAALGGFNKTDRIRALVMQRPEWTHEQLKAAVGEDVTRATLNTVRSVTLATIAVAKQLGKWVEA